MELHIGPGTMVADTPEELHNLVLAMLHGLVDRMRIVAMAAVAAN